jgi:LPXTG-motif cell wall-anchored protein
VNDKAVIGSVGNPNTVDLVYSNNPNNSHGGKPSDNPKPDQDIPTGKTPEEKTITYVAEIDLTKYFDKVGENNKLAGATFTLTGDSTAVKGTSGTAFVEAADGNYYKLANGTYTLTVPHDAILRSDGSTAVESNKSAYDADALAANKKYKLTKVSEYGTETQKVFMQGTSGADGKITFKGLGAGTYTLKETVTPEGYTTAADIEVVITVTYPNAVDVDGTEKATWSTTSSNVTVETGADGKATIGVYKTDVIDLSGATLPSTGGVGTTLFYVAGSIMVLAAAILLITKRRMGAND